MRYIGGDGHALTDDEEPKAARKWPKQMLISWYRCESENEKKRKTNLTTSLESIHFTMI